MGHCRSRPGVTPTSCFSPAVLAAARTCSLSPQLNIQLGIRPTVLINRHIPLWECPHSTLSENGLHFCSKRSHVVCELVGVRKIATSSYSHMSSNGGVKRVDHTMAKMHGRQRGPKPLRRATTSRGIRLQLFGQRRHWSGPRRASHGQAPALPLTVFDRSGFTGCQTLARDHLTYCNLASERQQRANHNIVRELHGLIVYRVER